MRPWLADRRHHGTLRVMYGIFHSRRWLDSLLLALTALTPCCFLGSVTSAGNSSAQTPSAAVDSAVVDFATHVWLPVMKQDCLSCHIPGGYASQKGSTFILQPSHISTYLVDNMRSVAAVRSMLLSRTLGTDHGGGPRFTADSNQYAALSAYLSSGDSSATPANPNIDAAFFAQSPMLSPAMTFRKASLQLLARVPTAQEWATIGAGGMDALSAALDKGLQEAPFYDWIGTIYNDQWLVEKWMPYNQAGEAQLNQAFYPLEDYQYSVPCLPPDSPTNETGRDLGLVLEPEQLAVYLVRHDLPFTGLVDANYIMMNPFSARSLLETQLDPGFNNMTCTDSNPNVDPQLNPMTWVSPVHFSNSLDVDDFVPGTVPAMGPISGVLTSPIMLQRYPSTDTNRNRGRARVFYLFFLDTDILALGTRTPTGLTQLSDPQSPTMTNLGCLPCHSLVDPIASSYQNYPDNAWRNPTIADAWPTNIAPAGFEGKPLGVDPSQAVAWLGQQIAADPRFVRATVRTVYTGLFGMAPAEEPVANDPNYAAHLAAFVTLTEMLESAGAAFVASNYNFKALVKYLVSSPYYRISGVPANLTDTQQALLANVGTARRRSPEDLNRVTLAILGEKWVTRVTQALVLGPGTRGNGIIMGGIDSSVDVTREAHSNALINKESLELARELGLYAAVHDLARPAASRLLFPCMDANSPCVDVTTTPESPSAILQIRANIQYLHMMVLGEDLDPSDPEIEFTYQVFLQSWNDSVAEARRGSTTTSLPLSFQYVAYDPQGNGPSNIHGPPGGLLPAASAVTLDPDYTMRAWGTTLAYLLSDFHFLYD